MAGFNYCFNMRREAGLKEAPKELYQTLAKVLGTIESEHWKFNARLFPAFPKGKPEFLHAINLSKAVSPRCRCYLHYQVRPLPPQRFSDKPSSDDALIIDFSGKPELVADITQYIAPKLIEAFRPYVAGMVIDDAIAQDQPAIFWSQLNQRYTLHRLAPFQFMGKKLCKRMFDMTPSQVGKRVASIVDRVEMIAGGVLFYTPRVFTLAECDELDNRLKRATGLKVNREPAL